MLFNNTDSQMTNHRKNMKKKFDRFTNHFPDFLHDLYLLFEYFPTNSKRFILSHILTNNMTNKKIYYQKYCSKLFEKVRFYSSFFFCRILWCSFVKIVLL